WRLADGEASGLLDHARLCGRRPVRLLAGTVGGSTWFVLFNGLAALFVYVLLQDGPPRALIFGAIVLPASLSIALTIYALFPPAVARYSDNVKGWVALVDVLAVAPLVFAVDWIRGPAVDQRYVYGAIVAAAGSLPF